MTTIGKVRLAKSRSVRVVLDLDDVTHALLVATTKHTGKTEAEAVADALRCLFVALPRPEDGGGQPIPPATARRRGIRGAWS